MRSVNGFTVFVVLVLSGCTSMGAGAVVDVAGVDVIEFRGNGLLTIVQGANEQLRSSGPLQIDRVGTRLIISDGETHRSSFVHLTLADLSDLMLSGPGTIQFDDFRTSRLLATVKGGGGIHMHSLEAQLVEFNVQGSSYVIIDALKTDYLKGVLLGHANLIVDHLQAGELEVEIAGHGCMKLTGASLKQRVTIEGHGVLASQRMAGDRVNLRIAGHGIASVWAVDELVLEVDADAQVEYRGEPAVDDGAFERSAQSFPRPPYSVF